MPGRKTAAADQTRSQIMLDGTERIPPTYEEWAAGPRLALRDPGAMPLPLSHLAGMDPWGPGCPRLTAAEEQRLVDACLRGETGAWGELLVALIPVVRGLVKDERRLMADGRSGQSAWVNEERAAVENKLKELVDDLPAIVARGVYARFSTYAYTAVQNCLLKHRKEMAKEAEKRKVIDMAAIADPATDDRRHLSAWDGGSHRSWDITAENRAAATALERAMEHMPPRDRLVVQMGLIEGDSDLSIGRQLGIDRRTVKKILLVARERLKAYTGDKIPGGMYNPWSGATLTRVEGEKDTRHSPSPAPGGKGPIRSDPTPTIPTRLDPIRDQSTPGPERQAGGAISFCPRSVEHGPLREPA